MRTENENPAISLVLRGSSFIELLVLIGAGGGLFFMTDLTRAQWPWDIPPFNARFLGAVYLAAMVAVAMKLLGGRWAPARLVLPMVFTFTFVIFIMSLVWLDRFLFDRWGAWAWIFLYIAIPLNAAVHMWLYRRLPVARSTAVPAVPAAWRTLLLAFAVALGVYGLAQLFAPETTSAFWPWRIDAFHGQLYSAIFLTAAIGAFLLSRAATPIEYFTLGITYAVLGFFSILGVVIADTTARRVDWGSAGTQLWMALFAAILLVGLALMWQSRLARR